MTEEVEPEVEVLVLVSMVASVTVLWQTVAAREVEIEVVGGRRSAGRVEATDQDGLMGYLSRKG